MPTAYRTLMIPRDDSKSYAAFAARMLACEAAEIALIARDNRAPKHIAANVDSTSATVRPNR